MTYGASLDWLNFLLADVRGGLGPYVSVFLLTQAHWDQATIGAVLTVTGIVGITLHTPVGALIDTRPSETGAPHCRRGCPVHMCAVDPVGPNSAGRAGSRHYDGCARRGFRADCCRDHAESCRTGQARRSARAERRLRPLR